MKRSINKLTLILAVAILGLGCSDKDATVSPEVVQTLSKASSSMDRVIISNTSLGEVASYLAKNKGQVIRQMEFAEALVAQVPAQALKGLSHRFPEAQVTIDRQFSLIEPLKKPSDSPGKGGGGDTGTTQPAQVVDWGVKRMGANNVHSLASGAGVNVCVVDTGVSKSHPDLADNIIGGRNFVWAKGRVNPNSWNDDNGHGSHVAGTIAALDNSIGALGVAPEASIIAIKVLDRNGSGYLSDIADGIVECVQRGAHIINMSLGGNGDPNADDIMHQAVKYADASGVIVVVAAGNEGADISGKIPAGYAETIAVAATNVNDGFPSWSNTGLGLGDYSAPGVSIYSTWKDSDYNTISGTSMASPHVAGAIALELSSSSVVVGTFNLGYSISRQGGGLAILK